MLSPLSDILRDIEEEESTPTSAGATQGPVVTMAVEPGPSGPLAASHASGARRQDQVPSTGRPSAFSGKGRGAAGARGGLVVPGMGRITELKSADAAATSD